jgi:hypothetical protein
MGSLSGLLGRLTLYVSRSIFLYGLTCLRMGSTVLAVAHSLLALYLTVKAPLAGLAAALPLIAVYAASGMLLLPLYTFAVASLPAAWMALTNLAFTRDTVGSLLVFLRVEAGAIHALYMLHALNPTELSVLASLAGGRGLVAQLFWRVSSHLLREAGEMLQVHGLKGVKAWKSLAMVLVRGEELPLLYADGLLLKEHMFKARLVVRPRCLLLQSAPVATDLLLLLTPIAS